MGYKEIQFKSVTARNMGPKVAQAGRPVKAGYPSKSLANKPCRWSEKWILSLRSATGKAADVFFKLYFENFNLQEKLKP